MKRKRDNPHLAEDTPQAMQQKPRNMFSISPKNLLETHVYQAIQAVEHNALAHIKTLEAKITEFRNTQKTGISTEGWIKLIEEIINPAIHTAINEKIDGKFNLLNQKINQLYELIGLGSYDNKKKNVMDQHLLGLKKDLMRINFFKIMFGINEEEIRCLTKKIKKKTGKTMRETEKKQSQ